jgi:hypothetical protein
MSSLFVVVIELGLSSQLLCRGFHFSVLLVFVEVDRTRSSFHDLRDGFI